MVEITKKTGIEVSVTNPSDSSGGGYFYHGVLPTPVLTHPSNGHHQFVTEFGRMGVFSRNIFLPGPMYLRCEQIADATHYIFQVSRNQNFRGSSVLGFKSDNTLYSDYMYLTPRINVLLRPGDLFGIGDYYWRVIAYHVSDGTVKVSEPSETRKFVVLGPEEEDSQIDKKPAGSNVKTNDRSPEKKNQPPANPGDKITVNSNSGQQAEYDTKKKVLIETGGDLKLEDVNLVESKEAGGGGESEDIPENVSKSHSKRSATSVEISPDAEGEGSVKVKEETVPKADEVMSKVEEWNVPVTGNDSSFEETVDGVFNKKTDDEGNLKEPKKKAHTPIESFDFHIKKSNWKYRLTGGAIYTEDSQFLYVPKVENFLPTHREQVEDQDEEMNVPTPCKIYVPFYQLPDGETEYVGRPNHCAITEDHPLVGDTLPYYHKTSNMWSDVEIFDQENFEWSTATIPVNTEVYFIILGGTANQKVERKSLSDDGSLKIVVRKQPIILFNNRGDKFFFSQEKVLSSIPVKITGSPTEGVYPVDVHANGKNKPKTGESELEVLNINLSEEIPVGTWLSADRSSMKVTSSRESE